LPPPYRDRDHLLDDFYDHIFGEEDVSDDDQAWFDSKIASFIAQAEGEQPPGRRRQRGQPAPPARRRPGTETGGSGRRRSGSPKGDTGYGLSLFYGQKEDAS